MGRPFNNDVSSLAAVSSGESWEYVEVMDEAWVDRDTAGGAGEVARAGEDGAWYLGSSKGG
jgi:hypothetical protein